MRYWWVRGGFLEWVVAFESGERAGELGTQRGCQTENGLGWGGLCILHSRVRNTQGWCGKRQPLDTLWLLLRVQTAR